MKRIIIIAAILGLIGGGLRAQGSLHGNTPAAKDSTPDSVYFTIINADSGFFAFSLNSIRQIFDTIVHPIALGEDDPMVLASFLPTSTFYGNLAPASAAVLTHLYIDSVEIPINQPMYFGNGRNFLNVTYFEGSFIRYQLYMLADTAHTIVARFGSWDDICLSPITLKATNITNHGANLTWYGNSSTYRVEVTPIDTLGNPTGATVNHTVNDSIEDSLMVHRAALTISGLEPMSRYKVEVYSMCDTTATPGTCTFNTYGAPVAITLQNPDSGFFQYSVEGDTREIVGDSTTIDVYAGSNHSFYLMSVHPSSPLFGHEFDPTVSHLASLAIDDIEIPIDSIDRLAIDSMSTLGRFELTASSYRIVIRAYSGLIQYNIQLSLDTAHTILAHFDQWEGYNSDTTESIANMAVEQLVNVTTDRGSIIAQGALPDEQVTLYTVDGRMLASRRANSSSLRFEAPATGLYIIAFSNRAVRRVIVFK